MRGSSDDGERIHNGSCTFARSHAPARPFTRSRDAADVMCSGRLLRRMKTQKGKKVRQLQKHVFRLIK